MKKYLEKLIVFTSTLKILAFFSKRPYFDTLTKWATSQVAKLNILLNRPAKANSPEALAQAWQDLMPPDGKEYFKIVEISADTAYTEIHLHCPLRGTGDVNACYKLMNYDRKLAEQIGGQLIVLESQSNSGKSYCKLAIRQADAEVDDLIPAHLR